jgi:hypothetical protein
MKTRMAIMTVFVFLLAAVFVVDTAVAAGTFCWSAAWNMWRACHIDTREELHITRANCANILNAEERTACREEAVEAREEELEECDDQFEARVDACALLDEYIYDPDPLLDPGIEFIHPDEVPDTYDPNPYVSIEAGHTYVLRAGEEGEEIVVVHATDETREIQGVECRIVIDVVVEAEEEEGLEVEYEAVEVTDDWFAQDTIGNVYYCGEVSREFEDGVLASLDGSFEAGKEFAKAGVLIRAFPEIPSADRQEFALEEAEDIVEYVSLAGFPTEEMGGENEAFPCAPDGCLQTHDSSPLEPGETEFKFYIPDVGFVLAVAMEDDEPSGEREELVCIGDTLDILMTDPSCGIEDPEELLEELCDLSEFLCPEEDE